MNAGQFLDEVLRQFYALTTVQVEDNIDLYFFPGVEIDSVSCQLRPQHIQYLKFFMQNHDRFFSVWSALQNLESKKLFVKLILYRLLGPGHVRIHPHWGWKEEAALLEKARSYRKEPSAILLPQHPRFGPLFHYEGVPCEGGTISFDGWDMNVASSFLKKQYFFDRSSPSIRPEPGDYVIDAGTCLGDSALAFSQAVGDSGRVFSFDPLPVHIELAQHNQWLNQFKNTLFLEQALGESTREKERVVSTDHTVSPGLRVTERDNQFSFVTLDDFMEKHSVPHLDFIKMDIEGSEMQALKGAHITLERFRPKLAISLYHNPVDFLVIPQFLRTCFPFYELYLDHYTIHEEETILYARPRDEQPPAVPQPLTLV